MISNGDVIYPAKVFNTLLTLCLETDKTGFAAHVTSPFRLSYKKNMLNIYWLEKYKPRAIFALHALCAENRTVGQLRCSQGALSQCNFSHIMGPLCIIPANMVV